MILTRATVRFPSGDVHAVCLVRWKDTKDFPYCCRYCGAKLGDKDQVFCDHTCRLGFEECYRQFGQVSYDILAEQPLSTDVDSE